MPLQFDNPLIPSSKTFGVVTLTVLIEGEAIPEQTEISSVNIWQELNRIPRAKLIIVDGSVITQTFSVSNQERFVPGKKIEIQIGYRSLENSVFKGVITGQSIKARSNGNSILILDCADAAHQMTRIPQSNYFYDKTESEIFAEIIGRYNQLTSEVKTTNHTYKELLQYQATDWDFILNRADINGFFAAVEDGKITIGPPDFQQKPVTHVSYGVNLLEIDAEMKGENQLGSVSAVAWDYSKFEQEKKEGQSASPVTPGNISNSQLAQNFPNNEWVLCSGGKLPPEMVKTWADSKLAKHELAKIRGRIKIKGEAQVKPGCILNLEGVGDRFNGAVFVTGVKHSFYKGEWLMDVQFGLSPEWFSQQYQTSSTRNAELFPSINGLQIGLVTNLEDPEGEDRILVRLPMIDAEEQGIWARLSTRGAGNDRGLVFRPEIGDEVVVGFIDSDPNQPIILGSLHSSHNPAPIDSDNQNDQKGWVTRSGIKMILDDQKPALQIEMPSGRAITLDDDAGKIELVDGSGNKVVMNSNNIEISSASDLNIQAMGDLNIDANNINMNANLGLKAKAQVSAELEATGTTTLKGGMVQIN